MTHHYDSSLYVQLWVVQKEMAVIEEELVTGYQADQVQQHHRYGRGPSVVKAKAASIIGSKR